MDTHQQTGISNDVALPRSGLRTLHLFAGAGGGILADLLLGHIPVCAVEYAPYPRRIILARQRDGILPLFPIWDDVRTFDGKPWRGRVDVITGGFPCQDISIAGRGAGIGGQSSGLWSEMARITSEVQPRYVFVENSPMLTIRGLGTVLGDLATMGFDARWGVLGAYHTGAPHARERIWIVAYPSKNKWPDWFFTRNLEKKIGGINSAKWGENWNGFKMGQEGYTILMEGGYKPDADGVVNGVADWVDRLAATGNGQVPVVAATAWRILNEIQ